jgi:two-component system, OmpR family, sensor histidine kinase CiaH
MFKQARIKLTGLYLLIIMSISISFSVIIFFLISSEFKRSFRQAEMHIRTEEFGGPFSRQNQKNLRELSPLLIEDLNTAKNNLILNLAIINGFIFIFSSGAGYLLAGKTLKPIEASIEDQKRFIADASHELRTPLTALKTSIEVGLRDKNLTLKKAKKLIKDNVEDIKELESLSNNLLNLTNLRINGKNLLFEKVDIKETIFSVVKKIKFLANKKNIDLQVKVKKQYIRGNKQSLRELVLIFMDNALKYTPPQGKVSVKTKKSRNSLVLIIEDTGIGIPKEDIPHIFKRFYRVDKTRLKNDSGGFGLGLSLAKEIIDLHKGTVNVESKIDKGTTFIIKIPLKFS